MKLPKDQKGKPSASHIRSPKQERGLATRFGGKVTRGSGCGNEKADVRVRSVLRVEAKTTKNKSFSITREMAEKLETIATAHGEAPAFIIEFNTEGRPDMEVAVVPTWVLDAIVTESRRESV